MTETTDLLRWPASALVSFHYYPDPALVARLAAGGLRLVADSGAFSALTQGAPITVDTFTPWAHAVRDHTCWVASLDVIGDPDGTWDNWQALRTQGLDTIPTIHYGTHPKVLDRYAEEGVDFLGMGGMVGRKSEQARLMRWTVQVMRYARDNHPGMRFHGWGVTHPQLVMNLPWWSVDSSGFGQAYRFGRLNLFNPETGKSEKADMDGRDVFRLGRLLRRHYGTTPDALAYSTPANRPHIIRVSLRSYQLLEDHLRARHNVAPPVYGVRHPAGVGTNLHAVDGSAGNLLELTHPEDTNVHAAISGEDRLLLNTTTEGNQP